MKKLGLLTIILLTLTAISFAQTANDYFVKGNDLFKQQLWKEAEAAYSECIRLSPNEVNCYFNRGLTRQIAIGYEFAVDDFSKVISLDPRNFKAYLNRGLAKDGMKRYDEAIADYKQAISINYISADAYYYLAVTYEKKDNVSEALYNYSLSITYNPNRAIAFSSRGRLFKKQNKIDDAIKDFTSAIKINPSGGYFYFLRGEIYLEQNKMDLAEADFQKAIAIDKDFETLVKGIKLSAQTKEILEKNKPTSTPTPTSEDTYTKATQIFTRGNTNYANRNYEAAVADYSEYIKIYPNVPDAYYNRGLSYSNLGKKDLAIADLRQTLKLKPDFPNAQTQLDKILAPPDKATQLIESGNRNYTNSNYEAAIADYTAYLKIYPKNADVYYNRGLAYRFGEKRFYAIADFEQVLKLKPDYPEAKENLEILRNPISKDSLSSISQIKDVQPTDYFYEDLRSLIERYGMQNLTRNYKFIGNHKLESTDFLNLATAGKDILQNIARNNRVPETKIAAIWGKNCVMAENSKLMTENNVSKWLGCMYGVGDIAPNTTDQMLPRGKFINYLHTAITRGTEKIFRLVPTKSKP